MLLTVAAVRAARARRNRFSAMQKRSLGPFTITAIGLGAMPMSWSRDNEIPDESQSIKTIHAALDAGITLIDTADIYAPSWDTMGPNEELVAKALKKYGGDTDDVSTGDATLRCDDHAQLARCSASGGTG